MAIIFYYRENCHLCDAMRKALVVFNKRVKPVAWQEVDIDRDIELVRLYDAKVPVLCHDDRVVCYHFFDEQALSSELV